MTRVRAQVVLLDPSSNTPVSFGPGDTLPGWAVPLVTNPRVLEEESTTEEESAPAGPFDPSDHKADKVIAYLKDADPEERDRVIEAERARGDKARKTVMETVLTTGDGSGDGSDLLD